MRGVRVCAGTEKPAKNVLREVVKDRERKMRCADVRGSAGRSQKAGGRKRRETPPSRHVTEKSLQ